MAFLHIAFNAFEQTKGWKRMKNLRNNLQKSFHSYIIVVYTYKNTDQSLGVGHNALKSWKIPWMKFRKKKITWGGRKKVSKVSLDILAAKCQIWLPKEFPEIRQIVGICWTCPRVASNETRAINQDYMNIALEMYNIIVSYIIDYMRL